MLQNKSSLTKLAIIVVISSLVAFSAYYFFTKKSDKSSDEAAEAAQNIKPSGIDANKSIKKVSDVEEVVAKWVEANPQAILQSVSNMQQKMVQEQLKSAQKNIGEKKSELFDDKSSPSYSPKGYDVAIVEFFDYNCGYCKKANPVIEQLIKKDSKVKIIYKEFPILGQASEDMSSVALAVNIIDPSAYKKFHDKLMNEKSHIDKAVAIRIAKEVGVSQQKLEEVLKKQKDKIAAIINQNREVGASVGVAGTPGFVIGEELIPGAVDLQTFEQKISEVRKAKK
jgi:protein-disulfide isomerase